MTHGETLKIMAILKAAYPDYYRGMKLKDADSIVALWAEMLAPYPYEACAAAVKKLIAESPYVPKISDIVGRVESALKPQLPAYEPISDGERRSAEQLSVWYAGHVAELHAEGKLTAVECKERGLSYLDYFAQFEGGTAT